MFSLCNLRPHRVSGPWIRVPGGDLCCSSRTLGSAANGAAVAPHGDGLLLLDNILEEGLGALELPAVDRLGGLAGVLERDTEVRPTGAGRLRGRNLSRCVPNLRKIHHNSGQRCPMIFRARPPKINPTLPLLSNTRKLRSRAFEFVEF